VRFRCSISGQNGLPVLAVQDSDYLNKYKGDSALLSANVKGSGPFKVKQQGENEPLQLRANSTYWGTPPKVTDILVDWYQSTSGPLSSYELTIVDVANTLNRNAEQSLSTNSKFSPISHPPANVVYLGFNNTISPFDKVEVRQALASLLDVNALVTDVFPAGSIVADQLIPVNFNPGNSNTQRWYEQRPKDAQDLLASVNFLIILKN
jgi:ABC-type oligopeptide transport system substrate-binding subunit